MRGRGGPNLVEYDSDFVEYGLDLGRVLFSTGVVQVQAA